jgi:hypothetical protein
MRGRHQFSEKIMRKQRALPFDRHEPVRLMNGRKKHQWQNGLAGEEKP